MNVILCVSVLVRAVTAVWSVFVMRKLRDARILFFTGMLVLMAIRQVFTLAVSASSDSAAIYGGTSHWDELPGLIVSLMAFMFVLSLERLSTRDSRDRQVSAGSNGVSIYPALAIGLTAIAGIVLMSLLAYQFSRDAIRNAIAIQNLATGRTVCSAAFGDPGDAGVMDRDDALDRVTRAWAKVQSPYEKTYLCVIGPSGKLDINTLKPEMKGTDVGRVAVSKGSDQTVLQLLQSHGDWSGKNTNYRGVSQLVGYHYEPLIDSLVAVHVPTSIVDAGFQAAVAPWIGSMILIGGLLLPCSLGLMFRSSRQANALSLSNLVELRESEHQLRASESRFRTIFEQAAVGVAQLDSVSGVILQVNRRYCEIMGTTAERLQGKTWMDLTPPEDLPEDQANMARLLGGEIREFAIEKRLTRPDDSLVEIDLTVSAMWQPSDQPSTHIAIMEDITEKRRAARALRRSEERYRSLVNASAATVWTTDAQGGFSEPQPMWESFTGQPWTEYQHFCWTRMLHSDDVDRVVGLWKQAVLNPAPYYAEGRFLEINSGEYRHCEVRATPLFEPDGSVREWMGKTIDVTDRKNSEQALRASEEKLRELNSSLELRVAERTQELRRANEDLEAYAHSVAHDLRAPLRGMYGFAKALREDYSERLDDNGREYIHFIESAAHQMDDLIKDLLEYSRVGQSQMSVDAVDLDDVVRRSLQQLDTEIRERQAVIDVEQPLGTTIGHKGTLVQIVSNLVTNGIKFVAPGVLPCVRIRTEKRDKRLRLWIEDDGIGIAQEFRHKIFGVFERLHGVETYPGTGIGLAIVRRGVESMGGQFGVESEERQGSQFWVELADASIE